MHETDFENKGCSDILSDERTSGYSDRKKIFKGSTPLIKESSRIYRAYLLGDQRKPYIKCLACGRDQNYQMGSLR